MKLPLSWKKRVKYVLFFCFAFFTLLFSSIGLFDEGLGKKGKNRTSKLGARVAWLGKGGRKIFGGADKIFGGAHVNFSLEIGSEDQKKVFIPNYARWIWIVCLLSAHKSRSGGLFIAWRGVTESFGADLGSCLQIHEWWPKTKQS